MEKLPNFVGSSINIILKVNPGYCYRSVATAQVRPVVALAVGAVVG
jgi:hypothetical protein